MVWAAAYRRHDVQQEGDAGRVGGRGGAVGGGRQGAAGAGPWQGGVGPLRAVQCASRFSIALNARLTRRMRRVLRRLRGC
eukprot:2060266-Rhodomonas_salina.2